VRFAPIGAGALRAGRQVLCKAERGAAVTKARTVPRPAGGGAPREMRSANGRPGRRRQSGETGLVGTGRRV
jgi:hypothetical protein